MAATQSAGARRTTARETAARTTRARASSGKAASADARDAAHEEHQAPETREMRDAQDTQEAWERNARQHEEAGTGTGAGTAAGAQGGGVSAAHLDETVADAAVALARTPVTVIRKVAPVAHGLPVYLGIGGLAVLGAVEWPVAAAAGVGFAAMRRWGPLRGDQTRERSEEREHATDSA